MEFEFSNAGSIEERRINVISEGTVLQGTINFEEIVRVHGKLEGKVHAKPGSTLILAESSTTQGTVEADTLIIDGFVEGEIHATTKVIVSGTGRVIGNIYTPSLLLEFGAYFEGKCSMDIKSST